MAKSTANILGHLYIGEAVDTAITRIERRIDVLADLIKKNDQNFDYWCDQLNECRDAISWLREMRRELLEEQWKALQG
jgi:prefoldin subunit 5